MSSSENKYDTLEQIIFGQGLRIVGVHAYRDLDLLLFVLNTGKVIEYKVSAFGAPGHGRSGGPGQA